MRVRYVVETAPTHSLTNAPEQDAVQSVDYQYDIELDSNGRITGGEWYLNRHPDFLWNPLPGSRAITPADQFAIGNWTATSPLPEAWRRAAWYVSPAMLPLAKIVERLIELAQA
jgi:hypothetical protein